MASVIIPVVYLFVVIGGLFVFSFFYRRRNAAKQFKPYFKSHPDRDTYVTLLQQTNPEAPETVLKAALVRRAMADVHRAYRLREDKPALQTLLQKGSLGDDLMSSLLAAEKELEGEVREVVAEANTFVDGWGSIIFQTANEIIANGKMRTSFDQISKIRAEKELAYGKKSKDLSRVPLPSFTVTPTTPLQSPSSVSTSAGRTAATAFPLTATKAVNGVSSPPSAPSDPVASSDDSARPPASPRTPKSGKKGKKRK